MCSYLGEAPAEVIERLGQDKGKRDLSTGKRDLGEAPAEVIERLGQDNCGLRIGEGHRVVAQGLAYHVCIRLVLWYVRAL